MTLAEHIKKTLLLGLPLVGSQLAQIAIGTTDIIMLGWDGTYSLASGVLGTQAIFTFFIFGAGFAHAVVPFAAQASAQDNLAELRRVVRMGLWLTTLVSLIAMPILFYFEQILLFLGQEQRVAELAADYIHVAQGSLFFALWGLVLRNFFASIERAQIVFWAIVPGLLINILLNYMLIFGNFGAPALGVVGAAWASVVTNIVIVLSLLFWIYVHQDFRAYNLFARLWKSDWQIFKKVGFLGIPIAINIVAEISMFTGSSILVGWIGAKELAAHGIALQLSAITFMVPLGISNAAVVRVGKEFGRQNLPEIALAARAAVIIAIIFGLSAAFAFANFSTFLVGLFLDGANADSVIVGQIAVSLILIAAIFQLVDGLQIMMSGILRGFQDATVPMLLSLISYGLLGILSAYMIGNYFDYGVRGTWVGLTMGLAFASLFGILRYRYIYAKYKGEFAAQPQTV